MECLGEQQPLSALLKSNWSLPCQRNSMYVCSCPCFGGQQKTSAHTLNTCERRPFFFFLKKKKTVVSGGGWKERSSKGMKKWCDLQEIKIVNPIH